MHGPPGVRWSTRPGDDSAPGPAVPMDPAPVGRTVERIRQYPLRPIARAKHDGGAPGPPHARAPRRRPPGQAARVPSRSAEANAATTSSLVQGSGDMVMK